MVNKMPSNPYEGKEKEELRLLASQEMQKGTTESLKKASEILKELETCVAR